MKITKKQIKELHHSGDVSKLKEWFPSVFEEELEEGVWYKDKDSSYKGLICIQKYNGIDKGITAYGFGWISGKFKESHSEWCPTIRAKKDLIKATHQEIETALINEARKRYKVGDKIQRLENYYYGSNCGNIIENLDFIFEDGCVAIKKQNGYYLGLFKNGTWATIIPAKQMTQKQIEKELGYKIEIV